MQLVMKRHHKAETVPAYGDIALDTERHTVEKGGQAAALSPKEFDVSDTPESIGISER